MTKADLERIEKSVPQGPDPFGEVFREGRGGKAGPPPPKVVTARAQKGLASAPWRLSSLCLGASTKAKGQPGVYRPPSAKGKALPPWRAKKPAEDDEEAEYDPFSEKPIEAQDLPVKAPG